MYILTIKIHTNILWFDLRETLKLKNQQERAYRILLAWFVSCAICIVSVRVQFILLKILNTGELTRKELFVRVTFLIL